MVAYGGKADFIVAIDFGMTCTGVAYSMGPNWPEPRTLQHWPGKMISEIANKVPTRLQYEFKTGRVKAWGFQCDEDENTEIKEYFKLHLDQSYPDPRPDAPKSEDARRWLRDYLSCVHNHIQQFFQELHPRWAEQTTEFVFSVPTTWKNPRMMADLRAIFEEAGFARGENKVIIGLTEAEAAAVYASRQYFDKGDVILVCDAGGGTTDINVLSLTSGRGQVLRLQQLGWVEGRSSGSALIDIDFHEHVLSRLQKIQHHLPRDAEEIADMIVQGPFQKLKCSFGSPANASFPTLPIDIPKAPPGLDYPELNIENSKMLITQAEMGTLFNAQIDLILILIEQQYTRLKENYPGTNISHLVLSGGLGSSPYVRDRFKAYFSSGGHGQSSFGHRTRISTVEEPQLAVVHGLVMERAQALRSNTMVFKDRCCRLSYGVICRQEYDKNDPTHFGQKITRSAHDKKMWVENQIDWFLKQGEVIPASGICKPYTVKVQSGHYQAIWQTHVVVSSLPQENLPTNLAQEGVTRLCDVKSSLNGKNVEVTKKNHHWYDLGPPYLLVQFNIRVILGPADIKFRMEGSGQQALNEEHESIQVDWEPVS